MRVVVHSFTHRLLPLAHRLQVEGADVEVHTSRERYQAAYRGILAGTEPRRGWEAAVQSGEALLVTDDIRVSDQFEHAPRVYGRVPAEGTEESPLSLEGWWDGAELQGLHWCVTELGAWPGGQGRQVPSAVTLIAALGAPTSALQEEVAQRVLPSFRGIVRAEVRAEGELGVVRCGWPDLHQVWCLGQPSVLELLEGKARPPQQVEFGAVISVPPWPNPPTAASRPLVLGETDSETRQHLIFHDIEVHRGKLRTAGLDGLVAIGTARSRFLGTARLRVAQVAQSLGLKELQLRADAGEVGEKALMGLEHARWI